MYDQLLAEQETLKDKLADLEDEKRDGGAAGRPKAGQRARATADARRARRTRERDGDASEGDASRAQSQQSRRGPDRSFASGARRPPTSRARGPRGDAPRRPREMRRAPAEPPAARNRWGGVVDEAGEAKKAAEKKRAKGGAFAHKKTVPRVPKPRHGRPCPSPRPRSPRRGSSARASQRRLRRRRPRPGPARRGGGAPALPRRRSPKKRPKPAVAGHADRTPRPPPPDDGLDAAEPSSGPRPSGGP
ncbi:hypothetical protein SO694_0027701 [Aureococcus anophagefferens]|uniref:Uncharacterized protein n=1 Tax=Aureococcus anophagefferens TaxID=44056 RepID=A0ABR1FZK6_AURAN